MTNRFEVSSFYKFFPIEPSELSVRRLSLEARAKKFEIHGLIILAPEWINGTVSGSSDAIRFFEQSLPILFQNSDWTFKRSFTWKQPFRDFRVKLRPEIVTTRSDAQMEVTHPRNHLSPVEWQRQLESGDDFVVLDTRNEYETQLVMFQGAIDPKIENFSDFSGSVAKLGIPKNKKVLMYCTGGIRCEKAILEMERQGYQNVFQLDGGILNYLEQFPHSHFQGECFVFDGRVAVDQNLQPTRKWSFCPHCGQPGKCQMNCAFCGTETVVCEACLEKEEFHTCSHDCAYKMIHHPSRLVANY